MINALKKYLDKLNVKDFSELTEEEKETYRKWEEILGGRKLTDEDVSVFLGNELEDTLGKLGNPNLTPREDVFLKMKMEMIRKIQGFLRVPERERELLEQQLS